MAHMKAFLAKALSLTLTQLCTHDQTDIFLALYVLESYTSFIYFYHHLFLRRLKEII